MKSDRVPLKRTDNTKKRYGKHRVGAVPLTIWEDREFKELLKKDAESVDNLPKWNLSDHVSFILRDYMGVWDKPYRPIKHK